MNHFILLACLLSAHPVMDCMPVVESDELTQIFADQWTLFYDESTIPRAMQMGANANDAHVHEGNHRFNQIDRTTNANAEFPWKDGGGMHLVDKRDVAIVKFYWHPDHKPVRYYRSTRSSNYYRQRAWDWQFPTDSVVGEVIALRRNGATYPIEIRTLTREPDAWQPRVSRQFNSPADVALSLKRLGYSPLAEKVAGLAVRRLVLRDTTHAKPAVVLKHSEAVLPLLPDAIVEQLLNEPLKDVVYPSTLTATVTQILPANYHPAQVGAEREDCAQCHKHVAKHVNNFDRVGRDWYGYVRGSGVLKETGGIFSFHPFASSSIATNGGDLPVSFNQALKRAGYIAPYNGEDGYDR